eukprot:8165907-Lingulodinium_polyedra.AAC.1
MATEGARSHSDEIREPGVNGHECGGLHVFRPELALIDRDELCSEGLEVADLWQSPDGWCLLGLRGRGRVLQDGGNAGDGGGVEEKGRGLQEGVPQGDLSPLFGGKLWEAPGQRSASEWWGSVVVKSDGAPSA